MEMQLEYCYQIYLKSLTVFLTSLFAKLHAYGFKFAALRLAHSFFTNKKQRNKIYSSYSSWKKYFNIFLCPVLRDKIMSDIDFVNYVDSVKSWKWFPDNQSKQIKINATSLLVTMNKMIQE